MTVNWKSHPLPDKHEELNRAVTGRCSTVTVRTTLFFFTNQQFVWAFQIILINIVYIHTYFVKGGYRHPLKPPVFYFSNLIYSEPLKSAKLNKLFGLGFIEICFTPTEAFSSSFADSWRRQLTAGRDSSLAQLNH